VQARLLERFPQFDLAVYVVEADGYRPVQWAPAETLELGALLAVPDGAGEPIGIGMTSVLPRALRGGGFLGVQLGRNAEGAVVNSIVADSPAAQAQLGEGDVITSVNGSPVASAAEFNASLREFAVGDTVRLEIDRDGERIEASAELGQRPVGRGERRFQAMNQMSGPLSGRTDGFPMVLQHDIPLTPDMCGGQLLDLEGRCVGINVSRAGRVNTYAIPAATVRELLAGIGQPVITEEDMKEVRELIREVQSQLGELEEKLADLESRAVPAGE
jgi:serine protease Do